jgi:3-oxoacyl-[acyl-carrier protein] reductase
LAENGFDLALVDLLEDGLSSTAEEIRAMGRDVMTFTADVALHQPAQDIVAKVASEWGRIDFLLNNAGRATPTVAASQVPSASFPMPPPRRGSSA